MTTRRPPVIPEIAKAFQNDPRTQLALRALDTASSGAPVAQGKYAMADGVARMLGGLGGAFTAKKMMGQYGADETKTIADQQDILRQTLAAQGAAQNPAAPAAAAAGAVNPAAAAVALGAPPAPQGPPSVPPGPVQAQPPMPGPAMIPRTGGAPQQGPRPFGPSAVAAPSARSAIPSYLATPEPEQVPDAPAPVARPVAPKAEGATRSRLLDAAYATIMNGNPYLFSNGQEMFRSGTEEQTSLDEKATERRQHAADQEFDMDKDVYANATAQDRGAAINRRESTVEHNRKLIDDFQARRFQYGVHKEDQAFEAHQKSLDRANAMAVARTRAEISASGGGSALTDQERAALSSAVGDGRIDLKGITKFQAKVIAQSLVDNPGLNAVQLHARAVLAANAPAQRQAMTTEILPEVLNNVRVAGKALKFSDAQFIGKMQSWSRGQLNDPAFTNYMTQRNDAMLTVAQVMRGTGATDMSTKMEAEAARPTMSPRAWDAWYNAQLTALLPRVEIAERRGLVDEGTTAAIRSAYGNNTTPHTASGHTGDPLVDKYLGGH